MSLKAERRRADSSQRAVDYTLLLIAETSLRVSRREGEGCPRNQVSPSLVRIYSFIYPPLPACDRRRDKTIPAIQDPGIRTIANSLYPIFLFFF